MSLFTGTPISLMIVSSYISGLMTEFRGNMTIENRLYQGVASRILTECRIHTVVNGTQHRKSVVMIHAILWFIFLVRFEACLFPWVVDAFFVDLLEIGAMSIR